MAVDIRSKVISVAKGEVGYQRKSNRWNKYAAELYPSVQYQAYCGIGATWFIYHAGVDVRGVCWMPYVPYIRAWAKKNGAWKTSGQKDGDLVIFDWGGDGIADHVGIVWRDENASGYRSIEANTSAGSTGSQSNGGGVHVRYRGRKSIQGWVDLDKLVNASGAKAVGGSTTSPVKESGKASGALVVDGILGRKTAQEIQQRRGVTVDAIIGPKTISAWQKYYGTPVDGVLSGQTDTGRKACPNIRKDCMKSGDSGSTLIKAIQKAIGFKGNDVDGKLGPNTVKALQKHYNDLAG